MLRTTTLRTRRTAVIDESTTQRARVAQLLRDGAATTVVHETTTIRRFLAWLRTADRTRWPHVAVLGIPQGSLSIPDLGALVALREAGMRVVVLSPLSSWPLIRRIADVQADGVASTSDDEADLLGVITAVIAGEHRVSTRAHAAMNAPRSGPRLSMQEARVLELYSCGFTIVEVAERIGVRHDTARKYLQRVRDKFTTAGRPARTKLDLARIAWSEGYADPDESCTEATQGAA